MGNLLTPAANAALGAFFKNYGSGERAFATSEAIQAVRQVVAEEELSNNDLLRAIAAEGDRGPEAIGEERAELSRSRSRSPTQLLESFRSTIVTVEVSVEAFHGTFLSVSVAP